MPISHKVRQGETIATIGLQYGFRNWETVWNNEDNKDNHPWPNALKPGTIVKLPDLTLGEETASVGSTTTFTLKKPKQLFRVMPQDALGNHFGGKPYTLKVDGVPMPFDGTIPNHGVIEHELPFSSKRALLLVCPYDNAPDLEEAWQLDIGELNPVEEVDGVQQRLHNLGIDCGPIDKLHGPKTTAALKYFQSIHELEPTGELDDDTMEALRNPTAPVFPDGEASSPVDEIVKAVQNSSDDAMPLFQFKLMDAAGNPVPGKPFRFKHSLSKITEGYTDDTGHGNIRNVTSQNGLLRMPGLSRIGIVDSGTFSEELEIPVSQDIPEVTWRRLIKLSL